MTVESHYPFPTAFLCDLQQDRTSGYKQPQILKTTRHKQHNDSVQRKGYSAALNNRLLQRVAFNLEEKMEGHKTEEGGRRGY